MLGETNARAGKTKNCGVCKVRAKTDGEIERARLSWCLGKEFSVIKIEWKM